MSNRKGSKNLQHYAGEWVVFVQGKIIAHDDTLVEAMATAEKTGVAKKATVFKVPRHDEGPYLLMFQ